MDTFEAFDRSRDYRIVQATDAMALVDNPNNLTTDWNTDLTMDRAAAMVGCVWRVINSPKDSRALLIDAASNLSVGTVSRHTVVHEGRFVWTRTRWQYRRRWGSSATVWLGRVALFRAVVDHIKRTGSVL